ncbi:hypothetical protein VTN31DRAFT_6701 [Thermomyces dupontii]|uniref:uncharacterized protein n=1 Tax=Talaromyces thermophilus TaxID=28565 RepID=UPI0037421AC3
MRTAVGTINSAMGRICSPTMSRKTTAWTCCTQRLYLAPLKNPQRAIDLATGTGIWAIDFADQHPAAEVIGCDLSPVQPTLVPPNLKFLVDDIESEWAYETNPFDFVHARYLAGSIKNFGKLIEQCYRKRISQARRLG